MFVDAHDQVDVAVDSVEAVSTVDVADTTRPARSGSRRTLVRAGAVLLALAAYGASAQLATNEVVVKPGDTLTKIASTYRTSVRELTAYNGIEDPNQILVGQTIVVPPSSGELRHEVRAGDTLSSIAATYGTTVSAVIDRNKLPDANVIRIGQVLVVPRAASAAAPVAAPTTAAPPTTAPPAAPATTVAPTTTAAPAAATATPTTTVAPTTTEAPATTVAPTTTGAPTTTVVPVPTTSGPLVTIPRVTVPSGGTVSTMWVVQPGDTIASIAAKFGLSSRRLAAANALSETDELVPGQRIYVPQS